MNIPSKFLKPSNTEVTMNQLFLQRVNDVIYNFIECKLKQDPVFKDVLFYFSSSEMPGEGEHKILDII